MPNRYPGPCRKCGTHVPAQEGTVAKVDGRWQVEHLTCPTSAPAPARVTPTPAGFTPTDEQHAALDLFRGGDSMVIEAGAGTGKTSTLKLLGLATEKRGRYIAFNKAIVTDVSGSLSTNVTASTAHSLAFKAIGRQYSPRLKSGRMRPQEIAQRLGVEPLFLTVGETRRAFTPEYLAGVVMRAVIRFCQSADEQPGRQHFPFIQGIELIRDDGARSFANNDAIRAHLAVPLERAWADIVKLDGSLPFRHDHYLKLWGLSHPRIETDFILFDEAQDASPVMAQVVAEQTHAQRVYVGDANQAIYEFTGAVNSIEEMKALGLEVRMLTQSFRFGPAIAGAANEILAELGAEIRLKGLPSIESRLGLIDGDPDAVLCRTNACAVDRILEAQAREVNAHLVGGGSEIVDFAKGARDLMERGVSGHRDLACFVSWPEVVAYAENDELGDELGLNVKLVEKYGVPTILKALEQMPREADADLVISTAHKAKGREWNRVEIAGDFGRQRDAEPPGPSELRLQYVAVTRAKLHLDNTVFTEKKEQAA